MNRNLVTVRDTIAPVVTVPAGGYAMDLRDTVAIHAGTCRETLAAAGVRA